MPRESACVKVSGCDVDTVKINYSGSGSTYLGGLAGYVYGHSTYWTADGCTDNSKFSDCSVKNVVINSEQDVVNSKVARAGGFALILFWQSIIIRCTISP